MAASPAASFGSTDGGLSHPPREPVRKRRRVTWYDSGTNPEADWGNASNWFAGQGESAIKWERAEIAASESPAHPDPDYPRLQPYPVDHEEPPDAHEMGFLVSGPRQSLHSLSPFRRGQIKRKWIRGGKGSYEVWCWLCKSGQWLRTANREFTLHLTTSHGHAPSTILFRKVPLSLRYAPDRVHHWEALCGMCNLWTSVDELTVEATLWFIHVSTVSKFSDRAKAHLTHRLCSHYPDCAAEIMQAQDRTEELSPTISSIHMFLD